MTLFSLFRRKPRATTARPPGPALASAPASAQADPRAAFAAEVMAVVEALPGVEDVERLPERFTLRVRAHGESRYAFLENVYAETWELPPDERRAHIVQAFSALGRPEERLTWPEVRERLRPVVRPCAQSFFVTPDAELSTVLRRGFVPCLDRRVVVDGPTSMQYVVPPMLEEWGVGADEVFAAATEQVGALLGEDLEPYDDRHGPLLHLAGQDDYAASRLLAPGWLAGLRARVEGNPIAIVPERTTLFVGGDARPELVEWLARKALTECEQAVRDISPALYTVDARGAVVPYVRPGNDALAQLVRRGHQVLRGREYARQKATLEEHQTRSGVDVFVPTLDVRELDDGRLVAWTSWVEGVEALIPEADVVVAGSSPDAGARWVACLPFARAREIAGASWEEVDVGGGPPRYRTRGDISAAQREALLAADTPFERIEVP